MPSDVEIDAVLVADLLRIPEAEAARLLDELEAAGCVESVRAGERRVRRSELPAGRR